MKTHSDGKPRGLHLVTSATTHALDAKFSYQIAEGALKLKNSER